MSQMLAVAHAIKMKNKKKMAAPDSEMTEAETPSLPEDEEKAPVRMSSGGMMEPKHIARLILMKNKGGECFEKGGEVEDLLSDEESSEDPSTEEASEEALEDMTSSRLGRIMASLSAKQYAK